MDLNFVLKASEQFCKYCRWLINLVVYVLLRYRGIYVRSISGEKTNKSAHQEFFCILYSETSTVQHKNTNMYTIFPTCLTSCLPIKPTLYLKENINDELRCSQVPTCPPQINPNPSVHYTNYLQYLQSFYTIVESQRLLFLEEYLPKGTHCPYGFLSATLSALDVTLLSWSVGLFEGLATAFCEYKEVWSTLIFQYVLTIIIFV